MSSSADEVAHPWGIFGEDRIGLKTHAAGVTRCRCGSRCVNAGLSSRGSSGAWSP